LLFLRLPAKIDKSKFFLSIARDGRGVCQIEMASVTSFIMPSTHQLENWEKWKGDAKRKEN
jgi:hypothetical protein